LDASGLSPDYEVLAQALSGRLERARVGTLEQATEQLHQWSGRDIDLMILEGSQALSAWASKNWPRPGPRKILWIGVSEDFQTVKDSRVRSLPALFVDLGELQRIQKDLCTLQVGIVEGACQVRKGVLNPLEQSWDLAMTYFVQVDWLRPIESLLAGRPPFDRPGVQQALSLADGSLSLSTHPQHPKHSALKTALQRYSLSRLSGSNKGP
jgi:hypothetical protein